MHRLQIQKCIEFTIVLNGLQDFFIRDLAILMKRIENNILD